MHNQSLVYKIALGVIPGVGDITARKLLEACGSPEAIFEETFESLLSISGISETQARSIAGKSYMTDAEREAEFVTKHGIKALFCLDSDYPARLAECPDSPVMLYYKGNADLNAPVMLSIVGTRRSTPRGRDLCADIINDLAQRFPSLIVVSGLAYGIDITAHKIALAAGTQSIGVLAHGLHTIYPKPHTAVAREMVSAGGLLTDFTSGEDAERNNFLKRNRIIAGISRGTLIVESGVKGGAMVTAEMAFSYNRDVMALPGRPSDHWSGGCNRLIKRNIAALIESAADIAEFLNWVPTNEKIMPVQQSLFTDLSPEEQTILTLLRENDTLSLDEIVLLSEIDLRRLSSLLLGLEMKSIILSSAGNRFSLSSGSSG